MTFWDLAYRDGTYRRHWAAPRVPPELTEWLSEEELPPGATVLDVGCGDGLEAVYMARRGYRVMGLDMSPSALVRARRRAAAEPIDVTWCAGSVRALPVVAASVDLALDRGCFHLFDPEARSAYAAEMARVLRPGGRFLLRGARDDDEERGLFGLDVDELDDLFPPECFRREDPIPTSLEAPAGALPGCRVVLRRRL